MIPAGPLRFEEVMRKWKAQLNGWCPQINIMSRHLININDFIPTLGVVFSKVLKTEKLPE